MATKKQVGYEYKGWKLGEEIKYKKDGRVYEIVGFDEGEDEELFIAINCNEWDINIRDSKAVTSYIYTDSNCFEWVFEDEIEKIEKEDDTKKKDVLKLEFAGVFDRVACRVLYQNEKVLKRGKFEDKEIGVLSQCHPSFFNKNLFIRGVDEGADNQCFLVSKEEAELIKDRVKAINEKYGIKERWRAEENQCFWYVDIDCEAEKTSELFLNTDARLYQNGNYFKTREQAEEACRRVKEVLKQYQEELLKEE